MTLRKIIVSAVGMIVLLAIGFGAFKGLSSMKKDPPTRPAEVVEKFVKVKPAAYAPQRTQIVAYGRVGSAQAIDLTSEVQGKILAGAIPIKVGQNFRRGQLICRIDRQEAELNLKAQKSSYLKTLAEALPDLKLDYPERFDDWNTFFQQVDIDKALPDLPETKSLKEKTFLAARGILNQYYSIQSAQERLTKYNLYAPYTGSFSEVFQEVGSIANPGARIARVIRTDKLELEVPVPVADLAWVTKGAKVKISNEKGDQQWTGKIARQSDIVDPTTQSVNLYIAIDPNPKAPVIEGLYLRTEIDGEVVRDAMEIPRKAVFDRDKVYVVEKGVLELRTIQIHKVNAETILISGPQPGTKIVVEPPVNATEGMKVKMFES